MQKEALSVVTVKTLLAVLLFAGLGTIIVGGGYIIGEYSKTQNNKIVKPVDQETENYYNLLEEKCNGDNCCVSSLKTMRANNYKEADKNGKCPVGFFMNMMKCIASYQWCEPIGEKCIKEGRILSIEERLAGFPCCDGLNQRVHYDLIGDECVLEDIAICINCPNGECGLGENKCNCLEDCEEQIDTSDWQTYQSEKGGFKLSVPIKWDFSERISSTEEGVDLFLFFDKEAATSIDEYDYVQLNIRIKQNKLDLSMEDFYNGKQNTDLFRDARGGYKKIVVGGKDAVRFKEKDDIGADVVIIPLQGKFIEIDSANSNIETFNKILPTFKFVELADTSNWQIYRNEEFGFEIDFPITWKDYIEKSKENKTSTNRDTLKEYNYQYIYFLHPQRIVGFAIGIFDKENWLISEGWKNIGENEKYIFGSVSNNSASPDNLFMLERYKESLSITSSFKFIEN